MDINNIFDTSDVDQSLKPEQSNSNSIISNPNECINVKFDDYSCIILLNILKTVTTGCTDLMLVDSVISQKSDNKQLTFMCDVSRLFENKKINMRFSKLAEKREILEIIHRQKSQLNLTVKPNLYKFYDRITELDISPAIPKYITNQFITEEDNNKSLGIDQATTVFSGIELDKDVIERMVKMSKTMSTSSMFLKFVDDTMTVQLTPSDEKSFTIVNLIKFTDGNVKLNGLVKFNMYSIASCPPPIYMNVLVRKHQTGSVIILEINSKFLFTSLDPKDKKTENTNSNMDGIDFKITTSSTLV
jgi:hypothetical protein